MPLTSKGREIERSMEKTYGSEKKAEQVLYASKNAGKVTGIDREKEVERQAQAMTDGRRVSGRDRGRLKR